MEATELAIDTLKSSNGTIRLATDGLNDEQLLHRPTKDSNPMAWLLWHLSRTKDSYTALFAGQPTVWIDQGWAERFDMSHEAGGFGDTPEQVAAFRAGRDLLFGYAEAAQNATLECLERLTSQDMEREYDFYGNSSLGSRLLTMMVIDVMEHTGQIAYLRGMITGHGWYPY